MPKITAVLPNYNNVAFLERSISSLLRQTEKSIEIIIIDDCSNDGSLDLIRFFKKKSKKIKLVVLEERKGAAYCRNLGNSLATSPLIMVCDSGDINHNERAKDAVLTFKRKKNISLYSTTCIEVNTLDENSKVHYPRIFKDHEKPSISHPTVTYTKELTEKIKYREGNIATDQYEAFLFDAYRAGFNFWHTHKCFVRKLIQERDNGSVKARMEQRIANYKEYEVNFNG
jgi:glycosyltransferase involved in cell wall biosynthesis